jgi:hypothetical protein
MRPVSPILRTVQRKSCVKLRRTCVAVCTTSTPLDCHRLSEVRDYRPDALFRISSELFHLLSSFELHFRKETQSGLPLPNPRSLILRQFNGNAHATSLNCIRGHGATLVKDLLASYCNCRIFYFVKMKNLAIKQKIKGSEVNKARKLNIPINC